MIIKNKEQRINLDTVSYYEPKRQFINGENWYYIIFYFSTRDNTSAMYFGNNEQSRDEYLSWLDEIMGLVEKPEYQEELIELE